jgi:allantoate deiminase
MTPAQYALDLCARIAAHSDVPGTITRTFLSPATRRVHALLRAEMESLGMRVRTDAVGNLRGIYQANRPGAPVLLFGSHIDTVPDAGAFDGILGAALPFALLRSLNGRRFPFAIEVIAFSEEEGIRFRMPFLGSRVLVGNLSAKDLARTDADGISIAQAIRDFGLDPENMADAALTLGTFAFLEVHIEQGPVLDSFNLPLAAVDTIVGQTRCELTFSGQANHAGTTPMHLRSDALAGAAEFIQHAERLARDSAGLVATVGTIHAAPGAVNIIPGLVTLSLDVRHASDARRDQATRELLEASERIANARGLQVQHRENSRQASVAMDAALRLALTTAIHSAGAEPHTMPSGAGHDAMILARRLPAAMLFVRSPGGISHHPSESVQLEDVQSAVATCLHLLDSLQLSL